MGKAALEGLQGIERIDKGFHDSREINTVWYDPAEIDIDVMEKALKDAGTYVDTVKAD